MEGLVTVKKKAANTFYTYEEVLASALEYFNGDELAAGTWAGKYALKNSEGRFAELTPDDMHRRLVREFAAAENLYNPVSESDLPLLCDYGQKRQPLTEERIYRLFKQFKYVVPQGSVMAALGNPYSIASLSNCIVLPELHDSYGGVFYADQQLAQLFKRRCGVGLDISPLRPANHPVSNSAGTSTGAVSFMERFSNTTREVAQNGRRGALMITMDIAHPDIEEFITVKQDLSKVTGANISVKVSDEFMKAVENGRNFTLRWPVDAEHPKVTRETDAAKLWEKITDCAHNTAEPGIIYWDRQHLYSTSSVYPGFKNVSTNPCSEIAMQGGDSCRLMAINLFEFVEHPFTPEATFNFKKFYEITYEAQRLMDDLVDLELKAVQKILNKVDADPEPDYIKDVERRTWQLLYDAGKKGRRTGLGFTALADAMAALGLKFDGDAALATVEEIMKTKCRAEFDSSIDMAIERGGFEDFSPEIENQSEFVQMLADEMPYVYKRMMAYGRRNISLSTVAPTGTLSILTQTSSGIEPVFMLSYKRRKRVNPDDKNVKVDFTDAMGDSWQEFTVFHPKLKAWMEASGNTTISQSPYYGCTANDIDWEQRVKLQGIVQKYTTHSISSTINLPAQASRDEVAGIYFNAWKAGLKGITVYREGSRNGVLVADTAKTKPQIIEQEAPERPKILEAEIVRFNNNNEPWIGFTGLLDNRPYEIFTGKAEDSFVIPAWVHKGWIIKERDENGLARYDFRYTDKYGYKVTIEGLSRSFDKEYWNYAKLISGVLRQGMPLKDVVRLIDRLELYDASINTWKNGVARSLKKFIPGGTQAADKTCPECGDPEGLVYEEGCLKCKSCGNTKCG
ncbi:MAG: adenosylcobalamin-dependent ribonucleoside-diphosphate reductase [Bacteroidetes bacterium]|nr:MAG: adenosylcobalamin-dependent ribonucleoside-diphosphate reductase [Bacteroidota bacterium]